MKIEAVSMGVAGNYGASAGKCLTISVTSADEALLTEIQTAVALVLSRVVAPANVKTESSECLPPYTVSPTDSVSEVSARSMIDPHRQAPKRC